MRIPNAEAIDHSERYVRENYTFEYMIQIEVSTINGLTALQKS
jgi:hypothetical protein